MPVNISIVDGKIANASALPAGQIVIYDEFITWQNLEEIAGVIAHKMGHVYHNHAWKT